MSGINKIFIVVLVAATMLVSCAKEDISPIEQKSGGVAYLYVNLKGIGSVKSRAVTPPDTERYIDNTAYDITILYFDKDNYYLGKTGTLYQSDFNWDDPSDSYRPINALEVPYGTKKLFVIINNYDYPEPGVAIPRFTLPTDADKGKSWATLNQTLYLNDTSYGQDEINYPVDFSVNDFVNIVTGDNDGANLPGTNPPPTRATPRIRAANYVVTMTNYGVRFLDNNGTVINNNDNGLVEVILGKTSAEAKRIVDDDPTKNVIYMDRAAAMVEFDCAANISDPDNWDGTVPAEPTGATFTFEGWELNATNRKIRMYAEHEPLYTPYYNMNSAYRTDANYDQTSYGSVTDWTEYKKNFVYLHNPTDVQIISRSVVTQSSNIKTRTDSDDPIYWPSPVGYPAGETQYCPENTMKAASQLVGATTKVVVKGSYYPPKSKYGQSFYDGDSYFLYKGEYYIHNLSWNKNEMLVEYEKLQNASGEIDHSQGLAKDLYEFGLAAKAFDPETTDEMKKVQITIMLTNYYSLFGTIRGMVARSYPAIKYYDQGINYYEVLIRHDQNITADMALGKYGVVRNNWYKLILNKVTRPGTPWIPGVPDDPNTKPGTPDDFNPALEVTISVEPWTTNNRGVDLQ